MLANYWHIYQNLKHLNCAFVIEWVNGHSHYDPIVRDFFRYVHDSCWLDTNYMPEETGIAIQNGGISIADIDEIRRMLTWCLRSEYWCNNSWGKILEDGIVFAILTRLDEIEWLDYEIEDGYMSPEEMQSLSRPENEALADSLARFEDMF